MKSEKKELLKQFKLVIDDVMDHYDEYTDEEKAQIKDIFQMNDTPKCEPLRFD